MSKTRTAFSRMQIWIHWIVAILIFAAFFTHEGMGDALRERIEQGLTGMEGATPHTAIGGVAFAFILWRLVLRWRRGAPEPEGSGLQLTAAIWGHRLLYLLMIVVPSLGAAAWYGKLPNLGEVHEVLGKTLVLIALGHGAVALWHHFVLKDGTLRRMARSDAP